MKPVHTLSVVVGLLAVGVIALSAAAVLTKGGGAGPDAVAPVLQPVSILPDVPPVDEGTVDPSAAGVIVAREWRTGSLQRYALDGTVVAPPHPAYQLTGASADGEWQAGANCPSNQPCRLTIYRAGETVNLDEVSIELQAPFFMGEWAPDTNVFAALDSDQNLYTVEAESLALSLVKPNVSDYAWTGDSELTFATNDDGGATIWRLDHGVALTSLATVDRAVGQLFESPDGERIAFAQDGHDGWRLLAVGVQDGVLRDFGNLGAVGDFTWSQTPGFAIAWSPDMSHLAVGPVTEPFHLHVIQLNAESGSPLHSYALEKGFAGELKWSPDGSELAISTYALNRVWHEVYLLGMTALEDGPRFLLDGCEIVWSPDGRFVAVKREPSQANAVAAIRVDTGEYWHVVNQAELSPIAWGADEASALALALQPALRSIQLGK